LTQFLRGFTAELLAMRVLRLVVCLQLASALLSSSNVARAASVTEVLTAVEKHKTLPDLHIGIGWDRLQKRAKITREWIQNENGKLSALDVKELRYTEIMHRLLVDLRVGLYHDLEFHLTAPIILQDDSDIRFAKGVKGSSTIFGSQNADDPNYAYRYPITNVPASRERSGFGDMTFGLAWSPVTDRKDEAYPTLTLRADIIAPTGKRRDPADTKALPGGDTAGVGMGSTTFDLSIALSRRMRTEVPAFDPYVLFGAQLTIAGPTQKALGYEPPPVARFLLGTEIIIDEDEPSAQRYAIDLSFGVKYFAIGRTYSELSDYLPNFNQTRAPMNRDPNIPRDSIGYEDYDNAMNYATFDEAASCGYSKDPVTGRESGIQNVPCGELNRVDEYLQLNAQFALHIKPARWALFEAGVGFGINTDHFLTTERVGTDTDPPSAENMTCDGAPCVGRVNARNSQGADERSPYYDPRYDAPGRRLRIEETTNFTLFVAGTATF
jgi:hypothetical protein